MEEKKKKGGRAGRTGRLTASECRLTSQGSPPSILDRLKEEKDKRAGMLIYFQLSGPRWEKIKNAYGHTCIASEADTNEM